jgi:nitroreductase
VLPILSVATREGGTQYSGALEHNVPDLIDLLKTRRSVKPIEMTGPGPTAEELETILTLGARVPDHGKLVPWRFIVFEGDARAKAGDIFAAVFKEQNLTATADQVEVERKKFMHAPLVIGVVSCARPHVKIPLWEQELSAGASVMNIVTAANALGYVTNWLTGWVAFDRAVLDALGLAADEKMAGFVHIGRAKRPPEERDRPQLSSIVTRF